MAPDACGYFSGFTDGCFTSSLLMPFRRFISTQTRASSPLYARSKTDSLPAGEATFSM